MNDPDPLRGRRKTKIRSRLLSTNMFRTVRVTSLLVFSLLTMFASVTVEGQQPELIVQNGHSSVVSSVAFSRDGKTLATSGADQTIKLWDVASGGELRTL